VSVKEFDSVRTTVAVQALFGGRTIPAGTEGAVVEVLNDGACVADFELGATDDDPGFVQAELTTDQYEVISGGA
jgi:hypothetical protein